jgi:DNA-binding NarL/FixJ family response regulator
MALTVLLAEDHTIVRQGLRMILRAEPDLEVVGEASDGPATLRLVERLRPGVLVLDLMLPGLGGLEVARAVHRRSPRTHVVILSMHANVAYVTEALRAGASAYVLKDDGTRELVRAIREAAAGRRYLSSAISEEALADYAARSEGTGIDPYDTLTLREREVLQLTAEGLTGAQIAGKLFISPRTVESHRTNAMHKLGVRNQRELVRYAVRRGLVPGEP